MVSKGVAINKLLWVLNNKNARRYLKSQ